MIKLGRRSLVVVGVLVTLLALTANGAFGSVSGNRGHHQQSSVDLVVQRALHGGARAVTTLLRQHPSRAVLKALQLGLLKDRQVRKVGRHWLLGSRTPEARAASAGETCTVSVSWLELVEGGIEAQAQIGNWCSQPAYGSLSTYGCGELDEFWLSDNQWHQMSFVCGAVTGPDQWDWSWPTASCKDSSLREYRAKGFGTVSDATGVYGAATPWTFNYLRCRS